MTGDEHCGVPSVLGKWIASRGALVGVLVQLRRAGLDDAVALLLALPDVQAVRACMEEWLSELDAARAFALLRRTLPVPAVAQLCFALWGVRSDDYGARLSAVPVEDDAS
jgi:hypothetical protein